MAGPREKPLSEIHNTSRFCVENPHVAWVLLAGTIVWGIYGYFKMPQRKDPDIPTRVALVVTPWPGASADKVEELVTRQIEKTLATNSNVSRIDSVSRANVSTITVLISEDAKQTGQVLDDIGGRLAAIHGLPDGAGPVNYLRDFGVTATLLLTIASPRVDASEIDLRTQAIQAAIGSVRRLGESGRASILYCFPPGGDERLIRLAVTDFISYLRERNAASDLRILSGAGFLGVDGLFGQASDDAVLKYAQQYIQERYPGTGLHPDVWEPFVVRDPADTSRKLAGAAGDKYSYRQLEDFTSTMEKGLLATARTETGSPLVAKVDRAGILQEQIYLLYSQERLASYNLKPASLSNILGARNIVSSGGQLDTQTKSVRIDASGEFRSEDEIGGVVVGATAYGSALYLRDFASTVRAYESPRYLDFYSWRDAQGHWQRTRAIALSVQMGAGQQIGNFAKAVDDTLASLRRRLPKDLIVARTSDQPKQVGENVSLFMRSLYEGIALVVVVSFVGFWEWRSALLMALAIPLTLLMTAGFMSLLGLDIQQVSIASLIIALGLLVDDPVVAGDAIKRELAAGVPARVAAWLGPTRLATAILYATVTNVVAYLPFLLLPGITGQFLYALPVVMTCALVASRLVSMTFIPLLGYYVLRARPEATIAERRKKGFAAVYYRVGQYAIRNRWLMLTGSLFILAAGVYLGGRLKKQFFPKDLSTFAYVEIFLPEDTPFQLTDLTARRVERIIQETAEQQKRPLECLDTFVGGGAPHFWYSLIPEPQHPNYAQIVLVFRDRHDTAELLPVLQERLSHEIAAARIDVRQLETAEAVGLPVAVRIAGDNKEVLHAAADRARRILQAVPTALRARDDWGADRFNLELKIDPDRANLVGITNLDVEGASIAAINGYQVTTLREGDKQIPVVARLRLSEGANLDAVRNLYVYSGSGTQHVPLRQISKIDYSLRDEVIRRRNQFRTITVSAAPAEHVLPSEVMDRARTELLKLADSLPPGYRFEIGGEEEKQAQGFGSLMVVLLISVAAIFLSLVFQFRNAVKPFIVFAAVPYGAVGAIAGLWIMGAPFGFMGFLGIVSLVGVIVSHIIVLFDFIEERHAAGEPFQEAILDAGIMRLRPILITVGATVMALFPLALHGGPLWEPMCYAQIGGLIAATFVTLLLVPVVYAIFVLDLKLVKWDTAQVEEQAG